MYTHLIYSLVCNISTWEVVFRVSLGCTELEHRLLETPSQKEKKKKKKQQNKQDRREVSELGSRHG